MEISRADRDNGFDLIRLVGAALVLVHHSWRLTGSPDLLSPDVLGTDLGTIGVLMFFTSSGYLVTRSWIADPDPARFLAKRALRLFPLLVVTTVVLALVLGPLVSRLSFSDYFADPTWHRYITTTLRLGDQLWTLPGSYPDNPFPGAVNGSTWTIVGEVLGYVGLAVVGGLGFLRHRATAASAALLFAGWLITGGEGFGALAQPLGTFCIGVAAAFYVPVHFRPDRVWAAVAIGVWLATCWTSIGDETAAIAVAVSTLAFAFSCPARWQHPLGATDISYGLYLLSFPVQQTVAATGVRSPWIMLILSAGLSVPAAILSWTWLERPALAFKPTARARVAPMTAPMCAVAPRSLADDTRAGLIRSA